MFKKRTGRKSREEQSSRRSNASETYVENKQIVEEPFQVITKVMEKYYLDERDEDDVPSITEYYKGDYPCIVERYFTRFYWRLTDHVNENQDHVVLFHSNRLCLIGLAKSHVAISKGIVSINYNVGNCDRSLNKVKGKHKKGGMNLQPTTLLAELICKDGSAYKVVSCITGKLIETNSLIDSEKLSIEGDGYIAVILCKPENCDRIKSSLIAEKDYSS